jgi:holo-[acyl-carrier protein] synthase
MIIGVGIDVVEVERVAEKISKGNSFRDKVFSEQEILYCEKLPRKEQHYAVRFAAKEAFLKATGKGMLLGTDLHNIQVTHNDVGKPFIELLGDFASLSEVNNWRTIHLSLSHIASTATAIVIIES